MTGPRRYDQCIRALLRAFNSHLDSGPFLHIGAVVDVVMITYMGAVVEGAGAQLFLCA